MRNIARPVRRTPKSAGKRSVLAFIPPPTLEDLGHLCTFDLRSWLDPLRHRSVYPSSVLLLTEFLCFLVKSHNRLRAVCSPLFAYSRLMAHGGKNHKALG